MDIWKFLTIGILSSLFQENNTKDANVGYLLYRNKRYHERPPIELTATNKIKRENIKDFDQNKIVKKNLIPDNAFLTPKLLRLNKNTLLPVLLTPSSKTTNLPTKSRIGTIPDVVPTNSEMVPSQKNSLSSIPFSEKKSGLPEMSITQKTMKVKPNNPEINNDNTNVTNESTILKNTSFNSVISNKNKPLEIKNIHLPIIIQEEKMQIPAEIVTSNKKNITTEPKKNSTYQNILPPKFYEDGDNDDLQKIENLELKRNETSSVVNVVSNNNIDDVSTSNRTDIKKYEIPSKVQVITSESNKEIRLRDVVPNNVNMTYFSESPELNPENVIKNEIILNLRKGAVNSEALIKNHTKTLLRYGKLDEIMNIPQITENVLPAVTHRNEDHIDKIVINDHKYQEILKNPHESATSYRHLENYEPQPVVYEPQNPYNSYVYPKMKHLSGNIPNSGPYKLHAETSRIFYNPDYYSYVSPPYKYPLEDHFNTKTFEITNNGEKRNTKCDNNYNLNRIRNPETGEDKILRNWHDRQIIIYLSKVDEEIGDAVKKPALIEDLKHYKDNLIIVPSNVINSYGNYRSENIPQSIYPYYFYPNYLQYETL